MNSFSAVQEDRLFFIFQNHIAIICACETCVYLLLNSYYAALDAVSTAFFKIIRQFRLIKLYCIRFHYWYIRNFKR
ncbi:hypothetical protein CUU63_19865 [Bacillus halotolerans]|uniref:Uncharacterized protein n=1 Tax=Bacillus halotolerans TaxID=260554 RepID=A0A9Q6F078_9BACI|nr:hypothetical protein CUU63_19865 [Bacillus halotolerans]